MAFEREWQANTFNLAATSHMKLKSEGWSGKIIYRDAPDLEDRKFQFKIDQESWSDSYFVGITGELHTTENSYGYVSFGNRAVIGISLEHFGVAERGTDSYDVNMLGLDIDNPDPNHRGDAVGAWGSQDPYDSVDMNYGYGFMVTNLEGVNAYDGTPITIADGGIGSIGCGNNLESLLHHVLDYGNWARHSETILETDLPIFETDAELLAWCQDPTNPDLIATMLNAPADPEAAAEEAWAAEQNYYYIRNKIKYSSNGQSWDVKTVNANLKPYGKGKICLYPEKHYSLEHPSQLLYVSYRVMGTDSYNYDIREAPWNAFRWSSTDDEMSTSAFNNLINSGVGYVKKSVKYNGGFSIDVLYADTNILIFKNRDKAEQYLNDEIDASEAENWDEIQEKENTEIKPPWGDEDIDGDNGTNAQACDIGHRMFMVSDTRLKEFFDRIYDPTNLSSILDNNGLFGENQMNSILGLLFIPVNANKFATLGSMENIKLGGWNSNIQAQIIQKNNKLWEVGSTFISPVFNDFRDMEPYQQLFISLPYCGLHALNLSKYLGKSLSVKYACDLGTGQCCAHIYANNVEYDSFDGNMASQRPITAIDQQAYTSAMMRSITGMIDPSVDLVTGSIESGVGVATGQIGMVAAGGASAIGSIPRMAMNAIQSKQDLLQKPMTFKGGFFGSIGLFGNQRCHLIVAQRKTVRAVNERSLIGLPSGYGGTVSAFSGYLKCASFSLGQGFSGTAEEAAEIVSMMSEGVYL